MWGNGAGTAKLHGRAIAIIEAPIIGLEPVHHIAYAPEVRMIRVCMWGAHERDMTPAEISAADALLLARCR